jgi:hypothetical protein
VLVIPEFNKAGNLPEGVHEASWEEIVERFGQSLHRQRLLRGLRKGLESLKASGCKRVYLDGSFVTSKDLPGDFDCCWEVEGVAPELLDPVLLDFADRRAAQKAKFFGEFFLARVQVKGVGRTFFEFFQQDKNTGEPKGIIAIDLERF